MSSLTATYLTLKMKFNIQLFKKFKILNKGKYSQTKEYPSAPIFRFGDGKLEALKPVI